MYVVCMTSKVTMDSSQNGGMYNILFNLEYISQNVIYTIYGA